MSNQRENPQENDIKQAERHHFELPPKPKRGHGLAIFALAVLLLFGGLAAWRYLNPKDTLTELPQQAVQVYAATANIAPISVNTTLTGRVQAVDEAVIYAGASGEVRSISVAVGDYVQQGDSLFALDTTQLQGSYNQAQISRDMAREGVETARQNLERMQALYDSAAISEAQLEQAQTAYSTAQNQLRQAEAGISAAAGSLRLLSFEAPISGYVTEQNLTVGMYPPQTQPAVAIANLDELEIEISVSEYLIGTIKEGAPVSFIINSLSGQSFTGTIKTVALAPATGGLTYPVTVALNPHDCAGIMPGMFAEISLPAKHKEQALVIPAEAVITRGGQTLVAVLEAGDLPYLRVVETGLDNGDMIEIISGLSDGETVITKGQHFIIEGEAVNRLYN